MQTARTGSAELQLMARELQRWQRVPGVGEVEVEGNKADEDHWKEAVMIDNVLTTNSSSSQHRRLGAAAGGGGGGGGGAGGGYIHVHYPHSYTCKDPEHNYNGMAMLWLNGGVKGVKVLMQRGFPHLLSAPVLITFCVVYFFLAACTSGCSVPAGAASAASF
jgi:hypothetical protein